MHPHPVALVTGGSRGIGRGICIALARAGFAVAVNYQGNSAAAGETQQALMPGVDSTIIQGDVGVAADRERIVAATIARWGRIDVLVNNAGITSLGRKDLLEATEESWDRVISVNLKGPFFLSQRVAREMACLRDEFPESTPAIINITSLSAYAMSTNRGDYCVAKAGLSVLTQLFALRLADQGIRVYEVRPGVIETDMTAGARAEYTRLLADGLAPLRRWGTPDDVGRAVVALVTGMLPYSTGEVINIDGGFHLRAFPR